MGSCKPFCSDISGIMSLGVLQNHLTRNGSFGHELKSKSDQLGDGTYIVANSWYFVTIAIILGL